MVKCQREAGGWGWWNWYAGQDLYPASGLALEFVTLLSNSNVFISCSPICFPIFMINFLSLSYLIFWLNLTSHSFLLFLLSLSLNHTCNSRHKHRRKGNKSGAMSTENIKNKGENIPQWWPGKGSRLIQIFPRCVDTQITHPNSQSHRWTCPIHTISFGTYVHVMRTWKTNEKTICPSYASVDARKTTKKRPRKTVQSSHSRQFKA